MKATDAAIGSKMMSVLYFAVGASSAITRARVLESVNRMLACDGLDDIDDRRLRDVYSRLPVCAGDGGLFLPETWAEVETFRAYLLSKIPREKAIARINTICEAYPRLMPVAREVQQELPL